MPQNDKKKRIPPINIEDAEVIYKNFSGVAKKYNAAGVRNFHVIIPVKTAEMLKADGWKPKIEEPKEEGDERWAHLPVTVRYDNYPPTIMLVSSDGQKRTILDVDTVGLIDHAKIKKYVVVITGSHWIQHDKKGNVEDEGIKAYVSQMIAYLDSSDVITKHMVSFADGED